MVALVPQLALINVLLGLAVLALFVEMSLGDFLRVLIAGVAAMFVYNLADTRVALRHLRPAELWLAGNREGPDAVAAWRAVASLPHAMMTRDLPRLANYGAYLAWAAFFTWQLELSWYATVPLFAGIAVFVLYVQAMRFFALERALQPLLDAITRETADDAQLHAPGFALRTRLLAALPAINVITGVAAVGITGIGHHLELSDLGLAVIVSGAIAGTVSLALTLLLAHSITSPVSDLGRATERVAGGAFDTRVPVMTTDETGVLARSFNQMVAGLAQRERLREAFGTFVDPALTERVMEEGTDLAGEELDVSLLFMDIRGFTAYSERAQARDVVARLNDLYGQVVPLILQQGGHANKFIGDGLLAVFGAPNRLSDHADRAVRAALGIARLVRRRYQGELRVGVGVNSGRVVVGTIGGGGRLDFTVIGDSVNTAARVESATRDTGDDLLITEATRRALTTDFGGWDRRAPVRLKGKAEQVQLYGSRALAGQPERAADLAVVTAPSGAVPVLLRRQRPVARSVTPL